ncbi:MAG: FHA domain-containing protein [Clostridia bacterium]|nr:FHA domain-containing protein [Clostridia bacterium]MBQ4396361.1 FHA domain-containing protein [Clostridia bacterium]
MKEIFSYIVIIAVIALIGFICYMIWKKNGTDMTTDARQGNPEHRKNGLNAQNEEDSDETNTTTVLAEWSVVQLHPETGKAIKKMNLVIPASGRFTIGRSKDCDFVLQDAKSEDGTSRLHLGVGKDGNGYFAKPLSRKDGSLALTYINDMLIMKSFDLVDQQVIWLGNTPVAFVRNACKRTDLKLNSGISEKRKEEAAFERDYNETLLFGETTRRTDDNTFTR